ncbi:carbon monoxide dehydrogenase subunit G [Streptomyces sp. SLBN-118]|uniref:SRPBCC family protein n=1 Tax=Streptomyces sp. SLBN-118 TaxID=2768454 RepID=UPI001150917A|nr:SRPBCC family protein [Streptomyces sp. SLBN-118]TQK50400.1 carbon monoxide dehydrogenase subunit G [Streptomyces sp. SLBN-118]
MELQHSFTVPVPVDEAWRVLLDIERIAPCMPGASVDGFDGETIEGGVKVRVGPITVTYRGTATFREKDESSHRIVLAAKGKEVRGQGTANATVTGTLADRDGQTAVVVVTDLTITGRPAQFGRGVMAEVGDKLIGRFADCLAQQLAGPEPAAGVPAEAPQKAAAEIDGGPAAEVAGAGSHEAEPIDLLRTAGFPVAKRAAGVLLAVALAVLAVVLIRRKR